MIKTGQNQIFAQDEHLDARFRLSQDSSEAGGVRPADFRVSALVRLDLQDHKRLPGRFFARLSGAAGDFSPSSI